MKRGELKQGWSGVSEEMLEGVAQWREAHPQATMREIEDEIDKYMSASRAGDFSPESWSCCQAN